MAIKLIAMDIDGTLLDSHAQVPEENARAVAEAAARGVEIVLVTGRRFDFARPIADALPCDLHFIVSNGALIKSKSGETHQQLLLPSRTARRVIESTEAFRANAAVIFDRPMERQVVLEKVEWDDPLRGGYFRRNRAYIAEVSPLVDCLNGEDPIQVMFTGYANQIREVEGFLSQLPMAAEFSIAMTVYDKRDFGLVDVIAPGCSKGATLAEWVRRRGWSRDDVMAIGDNLNDLEMLQFAGLPVVMGNSVPELKTLGWRETLSNDQGGVAAAIELYAYGDA